MEKNPYSTKKRNNAGARAAALGGAAIAGIGGAYAANSLASDNDAPEVIPDEEVSFETPAPTPKPDAAQSTHNPSLNDKKIPDAPVEKMADIPAEDIDPYAPDPEPDPADPYIPDPDPEPVDPYTPEPDPEPFDPYIPEPEPEPFDPYIPDPDPEPFDPYFPEPDPEPFDPYFPDPDDTDIVSDIPV